MAIPILGMGVLVLQCAMRMDVFGLIEQDKVVACKLRLGGAFRTLR